MINVYRIYLGRSWAAHDQDQPLVDLLDRVPEFLFKAVAVPADDLPSLSADDATRRAIAKIAMTQAHVAVMRAGAVDCAAEWTALELNLAQSGFRRPIPVLWVVPPGEKPAVKAMPWTTPVRGSAWNGLEMARAVKDLAEAAAAAARKSAIEQLSPFAAGHPADPAAPDRRTLPTAEIAAAYHHFKASRSGGG
jgi:hypothetical protein